MTECRVGPLTRRCPDEPRPRRDSGGLIWQLHDLFGWSSSRTGVYSDCVEPRLPEGGGATRVSVAALGLAAATGCLCGGAQDAVVVAGVVSAREVESHEAEESVGAVLVPQTERPLLEHRLEVAGNRFGAGGRVVLGQLVPDRGLHLDVSTDSRTPDTVARCGVGLLA